MSMTFQASAAGDRFLTPGNILATVTRRSRTSAWADIRCVDGDGTTWTKRMPSGIPQNWRPLTPDLVAAIIRPVR